MMWFVVLFGVGGGVAYICALYFPCGFPFSYAGNLFNIVFVKK